MTHDEIDKLEAGREIDALVAEGMGLTITEASRHTDSIVYDIENAGRFFAPVSRYSTSISSAWEVVEKFKDYLYLYHNSRLCGPGPYDVMWECKLVEGEPKEDPRRYYGVAPTAPLAICRAFLKVRSG